MAHELRIFIIIMGCVFIPTFILNIIVEAWSTFGADGVHRFRIGQIIPVELENLTKGK